MKTKRKRLRRIIFETTDGFYELIKAEAKEQNMSMRMLITRLILADLTYRKTLRRHN